MNLRFLLVALLLLAIAALHIEGKKGGGKAKGKGKGTVKSKGKKDKIKDALNKKGAKGSKGRKVKVKVQKTKEGKGLNVQVDEGGPLLSFERQHHKAKGRKNCVFAGSDPEDPNSVVVVSQCKHFKAGSVDIAGEHFNLNPETGELDDDVKQVDFTGKNDTEIAQPEDEDYVRKWDAKLGDWVVEKVDKKLKKVERKRLNRGKGKGKEQKTRKRRQTSELYMQLGLYIDEGLWKQFQQKYGDENAEAAVGEFVDYMVDFTEVHFSKDLSYSLRIAVSKLEIWKTQPAALPNTVGYNMLSFLNKLGPYLNPLDVGLDDAIVLSGLELAGAAGYAMLGDSTSGACSNRAIAVVNSEVDASAAFVIAHELGHTLGMSHGSYFNGCFQNDLGPPFTACSKMQSDAFITLLDNENRNCLRDVFVSEPVNLANYPGQRYPPQYQVQQMGRCYVHVEVEQTGMCAEYYYNTWGDITRANMLSYAGLKEGAYCGAGMICSSDNCVTLDSSLGALVPVDGGWSPDWATDVENCNGGCSEDCKVVGQLKLEVEYRQCNNPYPKNGGKYCAGSISRSKVCGEACATGATNNDEYKNGICAAKANGDFDSFEHVEDCVIVCYRTTGYGFYLVLENGVECGSGGRCVDQKCLMPCPSSPDHFALQTSECPPVDDRMQWQLQTKTGDGDYDGTDGDVFFVFNGSLGSSEPMEPDTPHDDYKHAAIDTFDLETVNIGELNNIVVSMQTSTDSWLLEWCTLTLKNTGQVYNFTLNKILDNENPERENEYTLTPQ